MWYENAELFRSKIYQLATELIQKGVTYDGWNMYVYPDIIGFEMLVQEAQKHRLKPVYVDYKMEYKKKDFEYAKYFMMHLRIFGKEDYTESYDTKYENINLCSECKRSKMKQISELYIDKVQFKGKDIGITTNREIVISDKLYNILINYDLQGIQYQIVKHKNKKMKDEPKVYQIIVDNVLPQMYSATTFYLDEPGYCHTCKAYGNLLTTLPKYLSDDMINAKDINMTYEYIGGGYSGYRNYIISKKLYDILICSKIKGLKFDIVVID
jgi:hypothetical protein